MGLCLFAASPSVPAPEVRQVGVTVGRPDADHRYRIAGKIRLLLFWVGSDDVGGAHAAWRGSGDDQSIALLIGSDPRRAPRGVNEWGYVREHVSGGSTTVFGIRTVTDGDSPDEADARRAGVDGLVELGILCARVARLDTAARTTTVYVARDTTYRDVDRVLDAVERSTKWSQHRAARPGDAAPGFLTALDRMMRASAVAASESGTLLTRGRIAYVYKDGVYDLIQRRVERVPSLRIRSGRYSNLLRSEFYLRNRASGYTAGFSITYGTEGALAGVPVTATYQPSWWFKVEIALEEGQDVPPDPAAETALSRRIAALCLSAHE
jgi:hypothetical protein